MDKQYIQYPVVDALYEHYKGGIYRVLSLAKHSETDEVLVIYQSTQFGSIHARPLNMWFETVVNHQDKQIERFIKI